MKSLHHNLYRHREYLLPQLISIHFKQNCCIVSRLHKREHIYMQQSRQAGITTAEIQTKFQMHL